MTKDKTKSSIRQVLFSDKAQEIPAARLARFDGEYLFPQNDNEEMKAIYTLNGIH